MSEPECNRKRHGAAGRRHDGERRGGGEDRKKNLRDVFCVPQICLYFIQLIVFFLSPLFFFAFTVSAAAIPATMTTAADTATYSITLSEPSPD